MSKLLDRRRTKEVPQVQHVDGRNDEMAWEPPTSSAADVPAPTGALPPRAPNVSARFDGRRRRREAALVIGVALLTGAGGLVVGGRVRSPADEAAARSAPTPSRITVPVVSQLLESTLTLSGEIRYSDPYSIRLGGVVGSAAGEAQVVTRVPDVDETIGEGDATFEVSGRPVLFLQGALPMYRQLAIGSNGPDVEQLEVALDRLGYPTGTVDTVFDQATADALAAMYAAAGYQPEGATVEQSEALRIARDAVTTAEQAVRDANAGLTEGTAGPTASELLALRQALAAAKAAVPLAQQTTNAANTAARGAVITAAGARDSAATVRDEAVRLRDTASVAGAIDPDTDAEYTSTRRAELATAAVVAEQELAAAEIALTAAKDDVPTIAANGTAANTASTDAVALAQLQLDEATKPVDATSLQANVTAAEQVVVQARLDLTTAERAAGLRVSPGELMFVPVLPSTVTNVDAVLGTAATEQLATISTSDTSLSASVSRADADLVQVGDVVTIEVREVSVELPGTVVSIGPANADAGGTDGGGDASTDVNASGSSGTSSGSGRLEMVILADDPAALADYLGYTAKIRVSVASTGGEVLVVPVAALTVGPDGGSRVEVERSPVSDSEGPDNGDSETTIIPVEVGLSADGLVEVRGGALAVGDRVVIGSAAAQATPTAADAEGDGDELSD